MLLAPCMSTPALLCKRALLLSPLALAAFMDALCRAMPAKMLRITAPVVLTQERLLKHFGCVRELLLLLLL